MVDSDASESSHDTSVLQVTKDGNEIILKILIIGDLATGKTSFIKRYVHKFFSTHYRATEAVGAFVVFDVSNPKTFGEALKWKKDLDSKVTLSDGKPIPCVLLANKCDLPKEGPAEDLSVLNEVCDDQGFDAWFYTSAKDNINVDRAAERLVSHVLKRLKEQENGTLINESNNITLREEQAENQEQHKEKKCC
ncbi:ras-related protein Rab-32-like protein [Leptotrombidium deliense]|uniref:Ras-related protein Rab-32-like protein n=1 Tax=Leptotrombidium deliense TaxID=299467 RepID=A0A443SFX0_9ACAR|nr:ras-related protein Rab-32-like protein [Leptotrombidium deliense]